MAPSATSAAPNDSLDSTLATDNPNGLDAKTQVISVVPPAVQNKSIAVSGAIQREKPVEKPAEKQDTGKLSNAELKKRAKAEKAAKRAEAKQQQPEAFIKQRRPSKGDELKDVKKQGSAVQGQNQAGASSKQHKKTGSTSGNAQKPLQLKPAIGQATAPSAEPKKENKNVQLFAHLYGNPRRTTIAGTSKDVHPAVLSLGLQMSSYTVCGSNARCVATLIAFKRVGKGHMKMEVPANMKDRSLNPTAPPLGTPYLAILQPTSPRKSNTLSPVVPCPSQWVMRFVGSNLKSPQSILIPPNLKPNRISAPPSTCSSVSASQLPTK